MKLHIPKPCHERWDAMTPTQQGAFCQVCATEVIDFERMSDAEIKEYFQNATSKICGRFRPDQLDRTLGEAPVRRGTWKAIWVGLGLLLAWGGKAEAKRKPMGGVTPMHITPMKNTTVDIQKLFIQKSYEVKGTILQGETLTPVPFASIVTAHGTFTADEAGNFKFTLQVPENLTQDTLTISAEGFITKNLPIALPALAPIKINLSPDPLWIEPAIFGELEPLRKPSFLERVKSLFVRKHTHKVGKIAPRD